MNPKLFLQVLPARIRGAVAVDLDAASLVRVFVVLGFALRLWHYLANHTIWYDEAVLLANLLTKSYAGLIGPLNHAVAAPPIYLWGNKLLADLCGDVPYCWRFVPFAFSCATLLLTAPLAKRVLSPTSAAIVVGLTALSDNHIWLGCCIKPYASDCFLATALIYFFVSTEGWTASRRLAWLAVLTPPILCSSYPAVFILGGLLTALIPAAIRERTRGVSMWLLASLAAVGTFALLYFGPIRAQRVEGLVNEWERMYPNFAEPSSLPGWLIFHHSTIFQFCFLPVGFLLWAVAPLGIAAAGRSGRRGLVTALVMPFLLCLVGAAAKSYPYGFNRLMIFIAPCALLLGGLGLDAIFRRFPAKKTKITWGIILLLGAAVVPISHLVTPWERPDSSAAAKHIRDHRQDGDRVATDEQAYVYFFRGELRSLEEAATEPGQRLWVPMDHYEPDLRRQYVYLKLAPGGWQLAGEVHFRDVSVFRYERP